MRGVFWALGILALAAGGAGAEVGDFALADSSNLAGGVLIAHFPTGMAYTNSDVCEFYAGYALNDAAGQVNRADDSVVDSGSPFMWFVISAWAEPKAFCGVEFGIGSYDENAYAPLLSNCGACGTGFDPLEIPGEGWPAPGTGIALAASGGGTWQGNYVPVYYFSGYAYTPGTLLQLALNPTTSFAGWANCQTPPVPADAGCLGALGILQAGTFCEPDINPPGACCFGGGVCQILSLDDCDAAGGAWNGSPVCADPNPCPITWACCVHDEQTGADDCQDLTQNDCTTQGGVWHSGEACATYTCPVIRACCIDQYCQLTTEADCADVYQGDWMSGEYTCSPNPCLYIRACCFEQTDCQLLTEDECENAGGDWGLYYEACLEGGLCPWNTPAEPTTWGSIKAIYR